jgi:hypothetical protein
MLRCRRTGSGTRMVRMPLRGEPACPRVQATLGHGNIATTSGYLHARPGSSSGLHLDLGVFLR